MAIAKRHVLALLIFSGLFIAYCLRTCMSTAAQKPGAHSSTVTMYTEFHWTDRQQGLALGAFFVGYAVTQVPGFYLARAYGCKAVFGLGLLGASALTLLVPCRGVASNFPLLLGVRVATGLAEGVTYPVMAQMWSAWAPPSERATLLAFSMSGAYLGTCVALPVSAVLVQGGGGGAGGSPLLGGGWRAVFVVFGCLGVVWFAFWWALVVDSPHAHPTITREELALISDSSSSSSDSDSSSSGAGGTHRSKAGEGSGGDGSSGKAEAEDGGGTGEVVIVAAAPPRIVWSAVLKSRGVWCIVCGAFAYCWGFYLLLTELPSYLSTCLHFSVARSGWLAVAPFLAVTATTMLGGRAADGCLLHHRGGGSSSGGRSDDERVRARALRVRKLFQVLGTVPPAVFLVVAGYSTTPATAMACLILAAGFSGCCASGYGANILEVAGPVAGGVWGLQNTVATVPGFAVPVLSGALTQARGSVGGFRVLFWVSFAIYALSAAVFAGCATVDRDTSLYECGGGSGGSKSGSGAVVRRPTTTPDGPDRGMKDRVPLLAARAQ